MYDLANTVYAACIVYVFIPHFARDDNRVWIGVATTGSMLLSGLLVPIIGAFCDRTGRARTLLATMTVACVAAMACLSVEPQHEARTLVCLAIAHLTFQSAIVCYNALLPSVAGNDRVGRVSGLGTAVGYGGTILTLAVLVPVLSDYGKDTVIDAAALLFLLAALPCLLLVRDRRFERAQPMSWQAAKASWASLLESARSMRRERNLLIFLLGNFCVLDVLNTALLYFGDITRSGFQAAAADGRLELAGHRFADVDAFVLVVGLVLNVLAMLFAFVQGVLCDRISALRVMRWSAGAIAVALIGGALTLGRSAEAFVLTLVVFGAFGLAGLWTAGRKVVVQLAPVERHGELFGLYGLTTKLSVLGNLTFMVLVTHVGLRVALLAQLVPALAGIVLLRAVRIPNNCGEATLHALQPRRSLS